MKKFIHKISVISFLIFESLTGINGQTVENPQPVSLDSMTLTQIVQSVVQNHPAVKEAEEALNIAEARIGIAKSGNLPNVDATGSYTRIGPVPTIDFPGLGTFQLYPKDNYNASVNYNQVIYDFGKTGKNIKLATESKTLNQNNIELTKQRLVSMSIGTYYNLLYLQEALRIKNQELQTLNEHLDFVQKKFSTGSATKFEILSTQVKISNTEGQKLDLENARKVQISVLASLTGIPANSVKKDLSANETTVSSDTAAVNYALNHRLEMASSKEQETIAGLQYQLTRAQNNPTLNIFASGGGKNGYVPNLNQIKLNYSAGVGVRIPIFDGNRMKYNLQQSKALVNNSAYQTEITKRSITDDVVESQANCATVREKIDRNRLQLSQAEQAFSLAQVSFNAGAMTNLDLLDAETAVSESRLMLLKSEIDYLVSLYRLKQAMGDKLY